MTHEEIVADYIAHRRAGARAEAAWFDEQPSLAAAIRHAALCLRQDGKRQSHQRRIPAAVLKEAERRLQSSAADLAQAPDFEALHDLVERTIRPVPGIGALAIYDIAQRIGAHLGKAPILVHLHAGAKTGAAIFGLHGGTIRPGQLPPAFGGLTAAEIEDCLCIYKDRLRDGPGEGLRRFRSARPPESRCGDPLPRLCGVC